jgi:hypothetical protein
MRVCGPSMLGTETALASPTACPSSYWGVKYSNPSMTPLIRCLCQCLSTTSTVKGQAVNFSMPQRWVAPTLARVIVHSDCRTERLLIRSENVHIHSRSLSGSCYCLSGLLKQLPPNEC